MRLNVTAALLALAMTTAADVVRIPVARNPVASVRRRSSRLTKRATLTESLINNVTEGGYYATVSVGTPGQDLTMVLDTGSSDAWVIATDADLCTKPRLQKEYQETCGATFDSSKSSTYKDLGSEFEIQYVDGSTASGAYFTDDFSIGDKTVKDLQIGLANTTVVGTGILGIGFVLNEAAEQQYSNLVSDLVNQSLVPTMAYSLYLNDYYSSTGSILFGGVDTDKFIGNLITVPILPDAQSGNYSSFTVGLTGLSFAASNGTKYNQSLTSESGSLGSVLDSGTTLSYLPDAIATELFDAVGAYQYSEGAQSSSIALVDCALSLDFTFRINNTAVISVPSDELVIDAFAGYQDQIPSDVPFNSTCLFGIQNIGDTSDESGGGGSGGGGSGGSEQSTDYAILGDTFLRSAYVVYDLTNLQVGIAQANLNSTSTNVQELTAGSSSLPAFSGVASQTAGSSGTSTSSGGGSGSGSATETGTASGSGMLTSSARDASTSTTCTVISETASIDTCLDCVLATSVAVTSAPTLGTRMGVGTTSTLVNGASVATPSTAMAWTSVLSALSGVGVFQNATTSPPSSTFTGPSGVFSSSLGSFTDGFTASSSHNAAAVGRSPPGYEGLCAVVGITLACGMSGGLLFWL